LAAALLLGGLSLAAPDIKIPRSPTRWASDTAGFLSPQALAGLDAQLEAFERSTGHQVLLYIGKTTEGYPIEEFAVKAFEAWKVGRKGLDDGLVLFIMAEDRKIRIEVGYGLEGIVPDAIASRVINDILTPGIRVGDNDRAVTDAIASLIQTISGRPSPSTTPSQGVSSEEKPRGRSTVSTVLLVIGIIFFLILFITHPTFTLWLLFNIFSGGRGGGFGGGGGWGGGGGFSGGGGRSGGGGASGGW